MVSISPHHWFGSPLRRVRRALSHSPAGRGPAEADAPDILVPEHAVPGLAAPLPRPPRAAARPLRILHIALQGALRWSNVEYGLTADTGGHIKYVLELVDALSRNARVGSIDLVVRAFEGKGFDPVYGRAIETVAPKVRIVRIAGGHRRYVTKEEMWTEHEALLASLLAHVDRGSPPDLVHAHYADAGALAAGLKAARGIPFAFTGHSLGAVKAKAYRQSGRVNPDRGLDRRIAIENAAIASADLVIASSRDEAELQYGDYAAHDPGRVRILPPGIDRTGFGAASDEPARSLVSRFLTDPDRAPILAIARPVNKKNLAELVHTFGESSSLRDRANLVLIAGNRNVLGESECDRNLREIIELIDRYDLHGSVAYPKSHRADDIPALYRFAAGRRGVFVNPALNEPFGLTLLEAAAAGLPVVATDRGGPNDIIGRLGNGSLVTPGDRAALAASIGRLLTDPAAWNEASRNGRERIEAYDWDAHARRYLDLARGIVEAHGRSGVRSDAPPRASHDSFLATDIDGTLIGCASSLETFARWRAERPGLLYGIATGRSLHAALDILECEGAPRPLVMIVAVGSEIYERDPGGIGYVKDEGWSAHIDRGWRREAVDGVVMATGGFTRQPAIEQRRHKLAYFTTEEGGPPGEGAAARVEALRDALREAGLEASVIHSHDRFVDVLPPRADKGLAVAWVARRHGIDPSRIFVAGDSGNDIDMLRRAANPVIVANHRDGIAALSALSHAYVADRRCAGGIIEGIEHYEGVHRHGGAPRPNGRADAIATGRGPSGTAIAAPSRPAPSPILPPPSRPETR